MKTKLSNLVAALALCVLTICMCACDEWFDKSKPTSQPTAVMSNLQVHFIDVGQGDANLSTSVQRRF